MSINASVITSCWVFHSISCFANIIVALFSNLPSDIRVSQMLLLHRENVPPTARREQSTSNQVIKGPDRGDK